MKTSIKSILTLFYKYHSNWEKIIPEIWSLISCHKH